MSVLAKSEEADINHIIFAIALQASEEDLGLGGTPSIIEDSTKIRMD